MREGEDHKSLVEGVNGCCSFAAQPCARVVLLCSDPPTSMGRPASPFIDEGKARVTDKEKEKNERETKASRDASSFFSFMWVPPIL